MFQKKKKALQLVMKLPLKDNHGGIQRAVRHKFTNEDLVKPGALKKVMEFLANMLQQGKFVRLRNWMLRWETFNQKPGWSVEKYLTEYNALVSEAKVEFGTEI